MSLLIYKYLLKRCVDTAYWPLYQHTVCNLLQHFNGQTYNVEKWYLGLTDQSIVRLTKSLSFDSLCLQVNAKSIWPILLSKKCQKLSHYKIFSHFRQKMTYNTLKSNLSWTKNVVKFWTTVTGSWALFALHKKTSNHHTS